MATFNSAFASARKAGKKTFTWNGKSYNTKVRSDQAPSSSARPNARPQRSNATAGRATSNNARPHAATSPRSSAVTRGSADATKPRANNTNRERTRSWSDRNSSRTEPRRPRK